MAVLKRKGDFDRVFRQGKRYRGRALTLACVGRPEGALRAAFVAGKAVGGAVRRNRQRRRLREAFRQLAPPTELPADLVFVAQPAAAKVAFTALSREMATLLRRAGLLPTSERSVHEAAP